MAQNFKIKRRCAKLVKKKNPVSSPAIAKVTIDLDESVGGTPKKAPDLSFSSTPIILSSSPGPSSNLTSEIRDLYGINDLSPLYYSDTVEGYRSEIRYLRLKLAKLRQTDQLAEAESQNSELVEQIQTLKNQNVNLKQQLDQAHNQNNVLIRDSETFLGQLRAELGGTDLSLGQILGKVKQLVQLFEDVQLKKEICQEKLSLRNSRVIDLEQSDESVKLYSDSEQLSDKYRNASMLECGCQTLPVLWPSKHTQTTGIPEYEVSSPLVESPSSYKSLSSLSIPVMKKSSSSSKEPSCSVNELVVDSNCQVEVVPFKVRRSSRIRQRTFNPSDLYLTNRGMY
ncbi:unnamed protein product [Moneuplotes crassus]|uniref:Uncharacterized protein n=1 Tax=Euplotes crassus TaxID=5936 RepID=A0AAD1XL48_EUPCR|nr:unnamed protein product [Moneuplotes crassus]